MSKAQYNSRMKILRDAAGQVPGGEVANKDERAYIVSYFLLPRSTHRINGRCGHLHADTLCPTPFPCPFTVDRPFLRDTSQRSACASRVPHPLPP